MLMLLYFVIKGPLSFIFLSTTQAVRMITTLPLFLSAKHLC